MYALARWPRQGVALPGPPIATWYVAGDEKSECIPSCHTNHANLFSQYQAAGLLCSTFRFNILLGAASKQHTAASKAAAKRAEELMVQWGVAPDRVTINSKIKHAIKQGNLEEAIDIFEQALDGVSLFLWWERFSHSGEEKINAVCCLIVHCASLSAQTCKSA